MFRSPLALAGLWLAAVIAGLMAAPSARAAGERPAAVRVEMTDEMGPVLADSRGLTLYTWGGDRKAGESLCTSKRFTHANGAGSMSYELPEPQKRAACAQIWPPFLASADAEPVGDWALITREDKARQWTYLGKPLYTYAQDGQPGETNGMDGSSGRYLTGRYPAWAPLDSPRHVTAGNTAAGRVLMTEHGGVLYVQKGGVTKVSSCRGPCQTAWKPLAAPAVARAPRGWSIVDPGDGRPQWAYLGKALFTYTGDVGFGDVNGRDEAGWEPVVLQKPLPPPAELTIQITADGDVYADRNGMTLYSWGCGDEGPDRALCDIPGATQTYRLSICGAPATCIATWRPV
ncbi:MAG: hypothetical protein JWQ29_794, partial [Phenylobacterium sp.]|nr:hypothetical protein [Phenylobacterium sp.]